MLIVSDTSPLRALQVLSLLGLLEPLYSQVLIPPAVYTELSRARIGVPPLDIAQHSFIEVRSPKLVRGFPRLGPGESEAISLALELGATELLIDEVGARSVATTLGMKPIGVLGVLIQGKQRGLVQQVAPLIEQLQQRISFRVSDAVVAEVLRQAGESRP